MFQSHGGAPWAGEGEHVRVLYIRVILRAVLYVVVAGAGFLPAGYDDLYSITQFPVSAARRAWHVCTQLWCAGAAPI